ncbi:MAG: hypothetical protein LBV20_01010 [Treponema sp.]|jgi:hypothetical protein|nr:hypothetical protein [Treponema sp.]
MMKKRYRIAALCILFAVPLLSLSAKDFGVLLDQNAAFSVIGQTNAFEYHGTITPWFSSSLGNNAEVFVSASFSANLDGQDWTFVPELLRTEFDFGVGENGSFRFGRMSYADPLGFIANGLFDGARYSLSLANGSTLSAGAWYTGLLYKKNAHITITSNELDSYKKTFEYANFLDSYFAPRRVIAAVDWNHPGIAELVRLNLSLLAQFDVNGSDSYYHSQYFIAKASVPYNQFVFDAGAAVEMAQATGNIQVAFAGDASVAWMLPTTWNDRLGLLGRFTSGTVGGENPVTAFIPVTTESHGYILKEKISGLSMLKLDYTARLHDTISIIIADSYFVLSDKGSYQGFPSGKDGYFLGNEIYGMITWSPFSDLQLTAGGGVFLPMLGNADSNADPMWSVNLNLVLALF